MPTTQSFGQTFCCMPWAAIRPEHHWLVCFEIIPKWCSSCCLGCCYVLCMGGWHHGYIRTCACYMRVLHARVQMCLLHEASFSHMCACASPASHSFVVQHNLGSNAMQCTGVRTGHAARPSHCSYVCVVESQHMLIICLAAGKSPRHNVCRDALLRHVQHIRASGRDVGTAWLSPSP